MLITAYVFTGQQSHMSDMPLLHVICSTVKGNWYCLSRKLIMAVARGDNCLICDLTDVCLSVWICLLGCDRVANYVSWVQCILGETIIFVHNSTQYDRFKWPYTSISISIYAPFYTVLQLSHSILSSISNSLPSHRWIAPVLHVSSK